MFCRGVDEVKALTVGSIVQSAVMLLANAAFLLYFKMGLVGYMIANVLGVAVSSLYIALKVRLYRFITFGSVASQTREEMKR